MHFSASTLTSLLVGFALSSTAIAHPVLARATDTLTEKPYSEFQVSDGVAGNALAEVNAQFPVDQNNLAGVSDNDLQIIAKAAQLGESAETASGVGFDDAIDAAGGQETTAGQALQNGKIKNKILKLQTDILRIQIETAQGNTESTSDLAGQQSKLAEDVATDEAAAGEASTSVNFTGTD
ncbi:Uu.00g105780.m01.CDS01 [Anthostomella pinea]|uniref:Uu.00g105780.m01.CDS01 n=1 Tax=Anthostomella pinea TaxID=933095 RepID=A0AAI8VEI6_9PEZI|nr:Uu.00g105780.m01.CDS01 [Anthostomella pinea]